MKNERKLKVHNSEYLSAKIKNIILLVAESDMSPFDEQVFQKEIIKNDNLGRYPEA